MSSRDRRTSSSVSRSRQGCLPFRPMPVRDRLTLSPWSKWRYYGRFPGKLTLRIMLIATVIVHALMVSSQFTPFHVDGGSLFQYLFMPGGMAPQATLYTVDEVRNAVTNITHVYENVDDYTFANVTWVQSAETGGQEPVNVTLVFNDHENHPDQEFSLTTKDMGVFGRHTSNPELRQLLLQLQSLQLRFRYLATDTATLNVRFLFTIVITMDFSSGAGVAAVSYDDQIDLLDTNEHTTLTIVPNMILVVLASLHIILSIKGIVRDISTFFQTRAATTKTTSKRIGSRHIQENNTLSDPLVGSSTRPAITWESLRLRDKIRFFNLWLIAQLLGDVCLVVGGILFAFYVDATTSSANAYDAAYLCVGLGALVCCVSVLQYMEFIGSLNTLIKTIRGALPRIAAYTVSISPLFFGFAFSGIILFSQCSDRFRNMTITCYTLFAVLNGDEVRMTFESLQQCAYPAVGNAYMYIYTIVSICMLLNVFIFLVEDSFHVAKLQNGEDILHFHEAGDDNAGGGSGGASHEHAHLHSATTTDIPSNEFEAWMAILERVQRDRTESDASALTTFNEGVGSSAAVPYNPPEIAVVHHDRQGEKGKMKADGSTRGHDHSHDHHSHDHSHGHSHGHHTDHTDGTTNNNADTDTGGSSNSSTNKPIAQTPPRDVQMNDLVSSPPPTPVSHDHDHTHAHTHDDKGHQGHNYNQKKSQNSSAV